MSGKVIAIIIIMVIVIAIIVAVWMMRSSSDSTTTQVVPVTDSGTSAPAPVSVVPDTTTSVVPVVTPTPVADPSSLLPAISASGADIVTSGGRTYKFYPQYVQDDYGASVGRAPASALGSPRAIAEHCDSLAGKCVGFQTDGWLKQNPRPQYNWARLYDSATKGMYMRADVSPVALQRPTPSRADYKSASGATYGFYRGFESRDGDLQYVPGGLDSPATMSAKCDALGAGCVGFSSLGFMKKTISPQSSWVYWTENPKRGLYVKGA